MSAILHADADRRRSWLAAASLVLTAWMILAVWSMSPYAAWLDHAQMEDITAAPAVRLAVFTLGWMLMIIAMMFPGMLMLLARCVEDELVNVRRIAPLMLAYLAVWTVFGGFSYWGDTALHEFVEQRPTLAGAIAPGVVLLAGVYQLTPMKRVCLAKCRREGTVFATLTQPHNLWIVGLRHGVFCLGSCWALMLLMFAIGGVNLAWMLILGSIMTVERLNQWGEGIARSLGVALIIVSIMLVVV